MASLIESTIINGTKYTVVVAETDFPGAEEICKELDPPALPTSIASFGEFLFILGRIEAVDDVNSPPFVYWIGFTRPEDSEASAKDFTFLDGTTNIFTVDGQLPWGNGEPNNAGDNQLCANIDRRLDRKFNEIIDQDCELNEDNDNREDGIIGGVVCKAILAPDNNELQGLENAGYVFFTLTIVLFIYYLVELRRKMSLNRKIRAIDDDVENI